MVCMDVLILTEVLKMTEKYIHITGTILKETDEALEKFRTVEHQGRTIQIPKSHVIDDALRKYLKLPEIKRT